MNLGCTTSVQNICIAGERGSAALHQLGAILFSVPRQFERRFMQIGCSCLAGNSSASLAELQRWISQPSAVSQPMVEFEFIFSLCEDDSSPDHSGRFNGTSTSSDDGAGCDQGGGCCKPEPAQARTHQRRHHRGFRRSLTAHRSTEVNLKVASRGKKAEERLPQIEACPISKA